MARPMLDALLLLGDYTGGHATVVRSYQHKRCTPKEQPCPQHRLLPERHKMKNTRRLNGISATDPSIAG